MPEVTVDVGGRSYRMGCGEGEEEHLLGLATRIDTEAQALQRQFGQMPEGRLLMMTALMIADKLAEVEDRAQQTEKKLATSRAQSGDRFGPEREAELTKRINDLVARIESLNGASAGA